MTNKDTSPPKTKRCANCDKTYEQKEFTPFCTLRCRNVDLNRWLSGHYAVPGEKISSDTPLPGTGEDEY